MGLRRFRIPLDDAYDGDLIERSIDGGATWEAAFVLSGSPSEIFDAEVPIGAQPSYRLVRALKHE